MISLTRGKEIYSCFRFITTTAVSNEHTRHKASSTAQWPCTLSEHRRPQERRQRNQRSVTGREIAFTNYLLLDQLESDSMYYPRKSSSWSWCSLQVLKNVNKWYKCCGEFSNLNNEQQIYGEDAGFVRKLTSHNNNTNNLLQTQRRSIPLFSRRNGCEWIDDLSQNEITRMSCLEKSSQD